MRSGEFCIYIEDSQQDLLIIWGGKERGGGVGLSDWRDGVAIYGDGEDHRRDRFCKGGSGAQIRTY